MARRRWMPIKLEAMNPTEDYPAEDLEPMNAREWGNLCWTLFRWGATLDDFRYDNYGYPIRDDICQEVANTIEGHLSELPPDERDFWETQVAYWRHSGGFLQRGKREVLTDQSHEQRARQG